MIKDTNPDHYKIDGANFIDYMDNPKTKGFGDWMFANGYNIRDAEIVRCKNCRYWWGEERQCKDEMGFARHWDADDYCSNGERLEE